MKYKSFTVLLKGTSGSGYVTSDGKVKHYPTHEKARAVGEKKMKLKNVTGYIIHGSSKQPDCND